MAQDDQEISKVENRAREGASTWPVSGARAMGECVGHARTAITIRHSGAHSRFYFTAQREPAVWTALTLAAFAAAIAFAAKVIGRHWYERGALALRHDGGSFVMESARPRNFDWPWALAWHSRIESSAAKPNASVPLTPRNAMPAPDDIEANE